MRKGLAMLVLARFSLGPWFPGKEVGPAWFWFESSGGYLLLSISW